MTRPLKLAFTADLHWGIRPRGDDATLLLVDFLRRLAPDVLVLAGDIGAGDQFTPCLRLFADLRCLKALVPGNHDIWVEENDARGDSLTLYREWLPRESAANGFHYLDQAPLAVDSGLALAGSMNWYDYSWALDALQQQTGDWQERLLDKRFTRGRHNDARFVRWPLDDVSFTEQTVAALQEQLGRATALAEQTIAVTHHPAFYGLSFPLAEGQPRSLDRLLWDAFSGNQRLESVLARHAGRIPFVFSGHTHRHRENRLGPIRGFNIGGDYHFKRLLVLHWPEGEIEAHLFGDPAP